MNLFKTAFVALLATASVTSASNVIEATDKNFKSLVTDAGVPSLVEIYASWCGHCKRLAPVWEQLADAYAVDPKKGAQPKVQIVKIDGDIHRKTSKQFGVSGFPTIKYIAADGSVEDVNVGRDFESLSAYINEKTGASARVPRKVPSAVVQLTDDNFDELAYDPKKTLVAAFTASWCGHCKNLKPEYAKAADVFRNDDSIVLAEVDTTGEGTEGIKSRFKVQGYPTLLVFPVVEGLENSDEEPEVYNGGRKVDDIVAWVNARVGLSRNVDGTLGSDAGRVALLDNVAQSFIKASADVRETLLKDFEIISSGLSEKEAAFAKIYRRFADKINASEAYLEKESKRLGNIIGKGQLKSSKLDELQIKRNILQAFVPGETPIKGAEAKKAEKIASAKAAAQHGDPAAQKVLKDEL